MKGKAVKDADFAALGKEVLSKTLKMNCKSKKP